ncbi:MAG: iron-containing alcohol dehydrogenase [Armatimonadetes bacterium]|nr:iron-containing alcohol dehydrogenase [Armatimonadota bacterium]MDE2206401.1 iron-containing alcohol dehydrogenase [Armatimonadota bacterium]
MLSRFSFPTRIVFGEGAAEETGETAKALGARTALLVTDPGVLGAGLTRPVEASLRASGLVTAIFSGVDANPTEENVDCGVEAWRQAGADILVAVGGGSALDAAKAVRMRIDHHGPMEQYDDNIGGDAKIVQQMPPLLALPTTAGTGSEVGRSAVIICRSNRRKTVFFHPGLMPDAALCDPLLTASMPSSITAWTGMDALTHNLEARLATPYHPMADAIAIGGLRLCSSSLVRAFRNGDDLAARADMMMAAIMGATAFQKGLGATHSLAHPLSSMAGMHHGLTNAVLLPAVLEFNAKACHDAYAEIGRLLDIGSEPAALPNWIRRLNAELGISPHLSDYGITEAMIAPMAELAIQDGCHVNNPMPCDRSIMEQLYRSSL